MVVVVGVDDGTDNYGVKGTSALPNHVGVLGDATADANAGLWGLGPIGVVGDGKGDKGTGVKGQGDNAGVAGVTQSGTGVVGTSTNGIGVEGFSSALQGVSGFSKDFIGVYGEAGEEGKELPKPPVGVLGISKSLNGTGVAGTNEFGGLAGLFTGNVIINGAFNVNGSKLFMIDHPLDPANKYLYHSSVESTDMKNVYDGVVALDDKGEAIIELPDWFSALNKDFRYQLTAIGAPGPNLYIAEEISDGVTNYSNNSSSSSNKNRNNSRFKVAGGTSDMKVSWQVTGIRQDPYAKAHPIQVEEDKPDKERGRYTHPELYDEPAEKAISPFLVPPRKGKGRLYSPK